MKRVLVITIILLQAVGMFGQTRIEQYESVFPNNFVFVSEDENGYNVTKSFIVKAATLTYKANELVSFTLKSSGNAQATYKVDKMISEISRVKRFWIDKTEKYFVVIAFPLDVDNGMSISFVSNIDGTIMFDFLFRKELTEKEKKEQELLKAQERERRIKEQERQEQVRREKEIERILPIIEQTNISYAVNDYYNKKYFKEIKSDNNVLALRKLEFKGDVDVLLKVDTARVDIVKIGEEIVNEELNILSRPTTKYCTFNGVDYYKCQGHMFCYKKIYVRTKTFEKGYGGVRNRGGKFEYYKNIPDNVKKECELNFTKRGEYFFEYTIVGDDVTVKELSSLERKQKDEMRGRKTTGRMILNLGCGALLLGALAVGAAL